MLDISFAKGKRVLIAGASGGIGREVLRVFSMSGAFVGAHYFKNRPCLEQSIEKHRLDSACIQCFQADLTTEKAAQKLITSFLDWAGGIDILIQVTGGLSGTAAWDEVTEDCWRRDLDVNLTGPFFLAQNAIKAMAKKGGKIVLTSTWSARRGGAPSSLVYGLSKAGIEYLTKALARIGAPLGVNVNAICPGFTDTGFHSRWMHWSQEDIARRVSLVPLKRAGRVDEIADLICFLASPSSNYITGECIVASGGDGL